MGNLDIYQQIVPIVFEDLARVWSARGEDHIEAEVRIGTVSGSFGLPANRPGWARFNGARLMNAKNVKQKSRFTAVVRRDDKWWIGWIEEIPGVNGQGRTCKEFLESLESALGEALELDRDKR